MLSLFHYITYASKWRNLLFSAVMFADSFDVVVDFENSSSGFENYFEYFDVVIDVVVDCFF